MTVHCEYKTGITNSVPWHHQPLQYTCSAITAFRSPAGRRHRSPIAVRTAAAAPAPCSTPASPASAAASTCTQQFWPKKGGGSGRTSPHFLHIGGPGSSLLTPTNARTDPPLLHGGAGPFDPSDRTCGGRCAGGPSSQIKQLRRWNASLSWKRSPPHPPPHPTPTHARTKGT